MECLGIPTGDSHTKILYSPSTHRVIVPVINDLTGTIQLNKALRTHRTIYAAPISMKDMADSWTNQDIDDWEERDITFWTDLQANNS